MELESLISSLLGMLGTSGIITSLVLRRIDKLERILEKREGDKVEENVIRGEVLDTTAKLSRANTEAVRTITSPDACAREYREHREALEKLEHFLRTKSAEYLHAN